MRARKDLTDIFTTFLQFEDYGSPRWHTDPRLKQSFHKTIVQLTTLPLTVTTLASYWYQKVNLSAEKTPYLHLLAYIQEACYWAAYTLTQRLTKSSVASLYTLQDCFQLAIAEFPKVLTGFDPNRGVSLSTYAEMMFANRLRDILRQRKEIEICSDWALLRKTSKKRLTESLRNQGLSATVIQQYLLAWICFQELWVPDSQSQRTGGPSAEFWPRLAVAYRQVKALEQPEASPAQLEQWLHQAAKILRAYCYPQPTSLNETLGGDDRNERLDLLPSPDDDSLLGQLIQEEDSRSRQQQQTQVAEVLQQALDTLKLEWQMALRLYYQDQQNQSQIAQQLNCSQPSVARYLSKARDQLLTALVSWAKTELNNPITCDRIREQSVALEAWLKLHYGRIKP